MDLCNHFAQTVAVSYDPLYGKVDTFKNPLKSIREERELFAVIKISQRQKPVLLEIQFNDFQLCLKWLSFSFFHLQKVMFRFISVRCFLGANVFSDKSS